LGDEKDFIKKQDGFWAVDENQLDSLDRELEAIWSRRMMHQQEFL
jgi:hypothetical protein